MLTSEKSNSKINGVEYVLSCASDWTVFTEGLLYDEVHRKVILRCHNKYNDSSMGWMVRG